MELSMKSISRNKFLFSRTLKMELAKAVTNVLAIFLGILHLVLTLLRGGSRTAATSKMECFVMIVNGWRPSTIITKRSMMDVAAVLDPPLLLCNSVSSITFLSLVK